MIIKIITFLYNSSLTKFLTFVPIQPAIRAGIIANKENFKVPLLNIPKQKYDKFAITDNTRKYVKRQVLNVSFGHSLESP